MADNGERIQIPVLENPDIREINHFFSVSNLEGGDIEVKNLKTENYSGNTMEIWGDSYPIEHISKNISTIQNIISEFMIQKQTPAPII